MKLIFQNPFKGVQLFFAKRLKEKIEKKVLVHQTVNDLQKLINEYRLIMKKESKLSSNERRKVIEDVEKYIEDGYITAK